MMNDKANYVIFLVLARNGRIKPDERPEMAVPYRLRLLEVAAFSHKQKTLNTDDKAEVEVIYISSKKQFLRAWKRLAKHSESIPLRGVAIFADHTGSDSINGERGLIFSSLARCRDCGNTLGDKYPWFSNHIACSHSPYITNGWKDDHKSIIYKDVVHGCSDIDDKWTFKFDSSGHPKTTEKESHILNNAELTKTWRYCDKNLGGSFVREEKYWRAEKPVFLFHTGEWGEGKPGDCLHCGNTLDHKDMDKGPIGVDFQKGVCVHCSKQFYESPISTGWPKAGSLRWSKNKTNENVTVRDYNVRTEDANFKVGGDITISPTVVELPIKKNTGGSPSAEIRVGYEIFRKSPYESLGVVKKVTDTSITFGDSSVTNSIFLSDLEELQFRAAPGNFFLEFDKLGKKKSNSTSITGVKGQMILGDIDVDRNPGTTSTWKYSTDAHGVVTFTLVDGGTDYAQGNIIYLSPSGWPKPNRSHQCAIEILTVNTNGEIQTWRSRNKSRWGAPFDAKNPYINPRSNMQDSQGEPHFWYCAASRQLQQSVGLNYISTAINSCQFGPVIQVELGAVGRWTQYWSDEWLMNMAEDMIAPTELYFRELPPPSPPVAKSISAEHSTISIPLNVQGPVPVFIFYPGIADNRSPRTPTHGTWEYMPPIIQNAVPSWYNNYIIAIPNSHITMYDDVISDIDKAIHKVNPSVTKGSTNIGIFSGSGNNDADISNKIGSIEPLNLILMDPVPSQNLIDSVPSATNVYMVYNQSEWGTPHYYVNKIAALENAVQSHASGTGTLVEVSIGHWEIPAYILEQYMEVIQSSLVKPSPLPPLSGKIRKIKNTKDKGFLTGEHLCGSLAYRELQSEIHHKTSFSSKYAKNVKSRWRRFPSVGTSSGKEKWMSFRGTLGHLHAPPSNNHHDPGNLNTIQVAAYSEDIIDVALGVKLGTNILTHDEMKNLPLLQWSRAVKGKSYVPKIELIGSHTAETISYSSGGKTRKGPATYSFLQSQSKFNGKFNVWGFKNICELSQNDNLFIDPDGDGITNGTEYNLCTSNNLSRDQSLSRIDVTAVANQQGIFYVTFEENVGTSGYREAAKMWFNHKEASGNGD